MVAKQTSEKADLFGLEVDRVALWDATQRVITFSTSAKPELVVTPNTDHFLRWQKDSTFRALYSEAGLIVADGSPLVWLSRLLNNPLPERVTGIDLFSTACSIAPAHGVSVAIVGGAPGVATLAAANLRKRWPGIDVYLTAAPTREQLTDPAYVLELSKELSKREKKIVALCLGSPKQEELFRVMGNDAPGGVYLAIGAAVDFWAGTVARAPRLWQRLGIEWLFRFGQEPRRLWKRYFVESAPMSIYFMRALSRRFRAVFEGLGIRT